MLVIGEFGTATAGAQSATAAAAAGGVVHREAGQAFGLSFGATGFSKVQFGGIHTARLMRKKGTKNFL